MRNFSWGSCMGAIRSYRFLPSHSYTRILQQISSGFEELDDGLDGVAGIMEGCFELSGRPLMMEVSMRQTRRRSSRLLKSTDELTVAIVDPFGKHTGHHYYVDALARSLCAQGARVLVYVTELTGVSGAEPYEAFVSFGELYGPEPALLRGLRYLWGMIKAMCLARLGGAQVVSLHIFHFDIRDVIAVWLPRFLGMKPVLTLHDIESFGRNVNRLFRWLTLAGGSGYVLHNRHCLAAFMKAERGIDKPVVVVSHGNYCGRFADVPSREQARRKLGLAAERPILLFFGNSRPEKGLDLLIEACGKLQRETKWQLVIAGKMKPPQLAYYSSLARAQVSEGRIRIDAKHVSDEDAVRYYRAADIVVVPYRMIYESGVTIMAMSLGRAVLVSNLPPLVDSIASGKAGMIFESGDANSLATALERALKHRCELDEIGIFGYNYVCQERDWGKIGDVTYTFMKGIETGRHGGEDKGLDALHALPPE